MDVTLEIHEGPWVKVTDINVEIAGTVDLAELRPKWPLNPGDRFAEKAYDDLKNLYLNYLPNHGYPRVKVRGRVYLNEETNTAKILITVNPGPLSYFGAVTIKDVEKLETPEAAIREKITVKSGQVFSLEELFNSQRKLYATDLFRSVVLTPEHVPPQEPTIPIVVEIEEKKQRSLKVGVGYGDEDKVRTRLGLRFRNLGGGGRVLDLTARYSTLGYLFTELFTNPVVFGTNFDFVNESGARRRNLPGFNDRAFFTQARLERDIPWNLRLYLRPRPGIRPPLRHPGGNPAPPPGDPTGKDVSGFLFAPEPAPGHHGQPHRAPAGGILTWNNECGPTFLGSDMQFAQSVLDWRRYQALLGSNFVAAGRVKFGVIQPMQATHQIPISRLFFSGGADSVRGYQSGLPGPPQHQQQSHRRGGPRGIRHRGALPPPHFRKNRRGGLSGCRQCLCQDSPARPGAVEIFSGGRIALSLPHRGHRLGYRLPHQPHQLSAGQPLPDPLLGGLRFLGKGGLMRWIKLAFYTLSLLLVLAGAGAGAILPDLTNWGGAGLLSLIQDQVNGKVTAGEISGNPLTGLTYKDLAITGPDGQIIFAADRLEIRLSPWSIPTFHLDLGRLALVKPRVYLMRDQSGSWNVSRLTPEAPRPAAPPGGFLARILAYLLREIDLPNLLVQKGEIFLTRGDDVRHYTDLDVTANLTLLDVGPPQPTVDA